MASKYVLSDCCSTATGVLVNDPDPKVSVSENVGVPPLLSVIVILLAEFLMYKTLLSSI